MRSTSGRSRARRSRSRTARPWPRPASATALGVVNANGQRRLRRRRLLRRHRRRCSRPWFASPGLALAGADVVRGGRPRAGAAARGRAARAWARRPCCCASTIPSSRWADRRDRRTSWPSAAELARRGIAVARRVPGRRRRPTTARGSWSAIRSFGCAAASSATSRLMARARRGGARPSSASSRAGGARRRACGLARREDLRLRRPRQPSRRDARVCAERHRRPRCLRSDRSVRSARRANDFDRRACWRLSARVGSARCTCSPRASRGALGRELGIAFVPFDRPSIDPVDLTKIEMSNRITRMIEA